MQTLKLRDIAALIALVVIAWALLIGYSDSRQASAQGQHWDTQTAQCQHATAVCR